MVYYSLLLLSLLSILILIWKCHLSCPKGGMGRLSFGSGKGVVLPLAEATGAR